MRSHRSTRGSNFASPALCDSQNYKILFFYEKLEKAVAVRNSLVEGFSSKFQCCWTFLPQSSVKCYPCQGLGTFGQRNGCWKISPARLRELLLPDHHSFREFFRFWIFSSETATALLTCLNLKSAPELLQWQYVSTLSVSLRFASVGCLVACSKICTAIMEDVVREVQL